MHQVTSCSVKTFWAALVKKSTFAYTKSNRATSSWEMLIPLGPTPGNCMEATMSIITKVEEGEWQCNF